MPYKMAVACCKAKKNQKLIYTACFLGSAFPCSKIRDSPVYGVCAARLLGGFLPFPPFLGYVVLFYAYTM